MRWVLSIIIGLVIWLVVIVAILGTMNWAVGRPGSLENAVMTRIKYWRIGGKDMANPTPDSPDTVKEGADHFQHH
jgi:hypothetical protein